MAALRPVRGRSTTYEPFPPIEGRRNNASTTLSDGEQQMVAIGRALVSNPRVLLCRLGLAPIAVRTGMILVEQDIVQTIQVSDRIYCLQEGRTSLLGRPIELS